MGIFDNVGEGDKGRVELHYGDEKLARESIERLKRLRLRERERGVRSMYMRAKYHKYQTEGMRKSMRVYEGFLREIERMKGRKGVCVRSRRKGKCSMGSTRKKK